MDKWGFDFIYRWVYNGSNMRKQKQIKRACVRCKKTFKANMYHGLDKVSMGLALACEICRDAWMNGKNEPK